MRKITFKTIFLFTTLITLFGFSNTYGQTCNSELVVSKNRDARSASENDSTQYQLELTNNSSKAQSYSIETSRFDGTFKVKGISPATLTSSTKLDVTVLQNRSVANSRVSVPARSTVVFQVQVSVPSGTPFNKWGGVKVNAISDACEEGKISTLLKLFVADPTEE